ncbi:MAG: hypothetical protein LBT42_04550 [Tannerella sp.]|jgi:hypothetical protein|nr:hypothetical protein [Tannerella sp.]
MKNREFYLPLILVVAAFVVLFPILGNELLRAWDDYWMVVNSYTQPNFAWDNLVSIFTDTPNGQYGPVNQLCYTTIHFICSYNPLGYHLFSLLVHSGNVLLVYLLIDRLLTAKKETASCLAVTEQPATASEHLAVKEQLVTSDPLADRGKRKVVAFFTALLLAVHPMSVESVAWVSASKVLLFSFFTLSAMLTYLHFLQNGKRRNYIFTFGLFVLACGSKEQAVTLPFGLLLIDLMLKRNFKSRNVWVEKLPFLLFAIAFGLFTTTLQDPELITNRAGYPLIQRIPLACYALTEYIVKLLIPYKLLYLYPFPMPPGDALPLRFWLYLGLIPFLIGGLWHYRKNWPLVFGVLFFLLNIALTIHIAPMSRYALVADRYVYLPSVGIFFIFVWYSVHYLNSKISMKLKWIYIPVIFYFLYLGIYAHQRTYVWHDSSTLKQEMRDLIQERNLIENVENDIYE